ncbi:MAG: hypothetical protein K2X35_02460 [Bryobacteraceae bacterium]|nr:hypothetical protein [Bryobacteraceae bacterium]
MFRNSAACVLAVSAALLAQDRGGSLKIDFPKDSPVGVVAADWGESNATPRGGAIVLDLHSSLTLRNSAQKKIRGVTLMVTAQEVTPGGRASVSVPSLDIGPGETFPVRIDLRLLKPAAQGASVLVEIGIEGVLFEDLSFYGPNKLNSRRSMTVWELEARRDRVHFRRILEQAGRDGLQREILASLRQETDRPQMGIQVVRSRATNIEPEKELRFAFLRFPESPVDATDTIAKLAGNEARAPRLEIRNKSERPVKHVEVGWIVEDDRGREFLAGSVPADLAIAPGKLSQVVPEGSLKFPRASAIQGMRGYLSSVEFADGSMWVPSRAILSDPRLAKVLPPSAEEQRLAQIYRKKGLNALIEELKKF